MGFFNWAAPLFGHFADRWDTAAIEQVGGWIRPYFPGDCPENCRLLDVGGGTGALARRLRSSLNAQITVLDPTPEMLRYIPKDGSIRAIEGVAERMPFDDDSFDALIVTDAFHHFRDQPAAVREFARVVRSGGGVVVVEVDPSGLMRLIVLAEKALGEPGAFFTPSQLCRFMADHGIRGECAPVKGVSYRYTGTVT